MVSHHFLKASKRKNFWLKSLSDKKIFNRISDLKLCASETESTASESVFPPLAPFAFFLLISWSFLQNFRTEVELIHLQGYRRNASTEEQVNLIYSTRRFFFAQQTAEKYRNESNIHSSLYEWLNVYFENINMRIFVNDVTAKKYPLQKYLNFEIKDQVTSLPDDPLLIHTEGISVIDPFAQHLCIQISIVSL